MRAQLDAKARVPARGVAPGTDVPSMRSARMAQLDRRDVRYGTNFLARRLRSAELPVEDEHSPIRTNLQLLARVQSRESDGLDRECFGNIIELGERALRLEAARPLVPGTHVVLRVVFPRQRHYGNPQVPLHCVVRKAHDEPNLHYDLDVTVLDKESHVRLLLYAALAKIRQSSWSSRKTGVGKACRITAAETVTSGSSAMPDSSPVMPPVFHAASLSSSLSNKRSISSLTFAGSSSRLARWRNVAAPCKPLTDQHRCLRAIRTPRRMS